MNARKRQFKLTAMAAILGFFPAIAGSVVPTIPLTQYPLQLAVTYHPQVLIAIGNSQSMDGILSGAIMVGSGVLASGNSSLQNSSSPVNYTTVPGFTPPMQDYAGGVAPYTVTTSGVKYDNSPSRLNVAKTSVQAILKAYLPYTDFALEVYNTSSVSLYTTWVYYMSVMGSNFTFTNTPDANSRYVTNPCYGYLGTGYATLSGNIYNACVSMASLYTSTTLNTMQYMLIGGSSDDPQINDVLYANFSNPLFATYNGPSPATPYAPNFSLSNYNAGNVLLSYSASRPNIGSLSTGPTNAGYVPYSPQVMNAYRGFGYYASQSASTGSVKVPMTSAGSAPTTASVSSALAAFTPYLNPETNNTSSTEIKSNAVQSPVAGLLTTAKTYIGSLTKAASCPAKQYVLLITDGLPTQDLSGKLWPPLGSAAGNGYGLTATFSSNGALASTNDQALTDTITALTNLSNLGITTFVVGLGAGVQASANPQANATLTAMAIAGNSGAFFPATSPAALIANLTNILESLTNESLDTTAAAVSSPYLKAGDYEYQTSFNANTSPYHDWTGNVTETALSVITGGPTGSAIWSAQPLLDAQSNRLIATWNPATNRAVPFSWSAISASQQTLLQPSDLLGSSRLSYLRGVTSLEQRNGGTFRNRSHILGDIVNSLPQYVGPPSNPALLVASTSYQAFALANASRSPMLYVGANDGMLHGLIASSGAEKFGFIPNGVFSNLYNLTAPLYTVNHRYFVDGSPNSGDVQFSDRSWHTLLVGGENGGGKSIYAIDVTTPSNITTEAALASSVLWEFSDTDLGYTYSQPQIAQISTSSSTNLNFAVFFGNGYNSTNNHAVLYAINPQTGATLAKINLCTAIPSACNAALAQGLSTVSVAQSDGLQDQAVTQVYAGDLQGNLWAIDVSDISPSNWTVRLLFQARDASSNIQPITMPPVITLNPSYPRLQGTFVLFGTGQFLTNSDLTSSQTQTIYGVWDKLNNSGVVLNRSNLQAQTLTLVTSATSGLPQDILTATSNTVNWGTNYGWYDDLPTPGQRMMTIPILLNGSFLATLNTPPSTPCGMAKAMFLDINYLSGGAFSLPQLNTGGSAGSIATSVYNGTNPVGVALSGGYASAPVNIGINSSNYFTQLITMSTGQQISISNPNTTSRQSAWWQIQ